MSSNDYLEEPPKLALTQLGESFEFAVDALCKADMVCFLFLCVFCVVKRHKTSSIGGLPTQKPYLISDGLCMRCCF